MGSIIGAAVSAALSWVLNLITGAASRQRELDNAREQGRDVEVARENQTAAEKADAMAKAAVDRPSDSDVDKRLRDGRF